jgi:hypothetical protein
VREIQYRGKNKGVNGRNSELASVGRKTKKNSGSKNEEQKSDVKSEKPVHMHFIL